MSTLTFSAGRICGLSPLNGYQLHSRYWNGQYRNQSSDWQSASCIHNQKNRIRFYLVNVTHNAVILLGSRQAAQLAGNRTVSDKEWNSGQCHFSRCWVKISRVWPHNLFSYIFKHTKPLGGSLHMTIMTKLQGWLRWNFLPKYSSTAKHQGKGLIMKNL